MKLRLCCFIILIGCNRNTPNKSLDLVSTINSLSINWQGCYEPLSKDPDRTKYTVIDTCSLDSLKLDMYAIRSVDCDFSILYFIPKEPGDSFMIPIRASSFTFRMENKTSYQDNLDKFIFDNSHIFRSLEFYINSKKYSNARINSDLLKIFNVILRETMHAPKNERDFLAEFIQTKPPNFSNVENQTILDLLLFKKNNTHPANNFKIYYNMYLISPNDFFIVYWDQPIPYTRDSFVNIYRFLL